MSQSATLQVRLSPEALQFVEAQVAGGGFASPDDVVNSAIERLSDELRADLELCARVAGPPLSVSEFRQFIAEGVTDADAGRMVPLDVDDIRRRGRERLAARGVIVEP